MTFLLLHSPLVTSLTWSALVAALERKGQNVSVVAFTNTIQPGHSYHDHHVSQLHAHIANINDKPTIAVAHSGAGNILASLDPQLFSAHVFLDAMFPTTTASRFELFDDQQSTASWREIAELNKGFVPRESLKRFGDQIVDAECRQAFVDSLVDVPIALYEEQTTLHPRWPNIRQGLFVQWTSAYEVDAERARRANFQVKKDPSGHFKMLNEANSVASLLVNFANDHARENNR